MTLTENRGVVPSEISRDSSFPVNQNTFTGVSQSGKTANNRTDDALQQKVTEASSQKIDPRRSQITERQNTELNMTVKNNTHQNNPINTRVRSASDPVVNQPSQENVKNLVIAYEKRLNQPEQVPLNRLARTTGTRNLKGLMPTTPKTTETPDSKEVAEAKPAQEPSKAIVRTKHIFNELVQTETSYVKSLKLLIAKQYTVKGDSKTYTVFGALHQNGSISKQEMKEAEDAVRALVKLSEKNLHQLRPALLKINESAGNPKEFHAAVHEGVKQLKEMFSDSNTTELTEKTFNCMKQYPLWLSFSNEKEEIHKQLTRQLGRLANNSAASLSGLYIQPVQRLPRFVLLLTDIEKTLKSAGDVNDPSLDFEALQQEIQNNLELLKEKLKEINSKL